MPEFVFIDKEKEKKKKRIRNIIVLACIPVLVIAAFVAKYMLSGTEAESATTAPVKYSESATSWETQMQAPSSAVTSTTRAQTYTAVSTTVRTTTTTTTTTTRVSTTAENEPGSYVYVLNTNTMRIHYPYCDSVNEMSSRNRAYSNKSVAELEAEGYVPCGNCRPG